jgi:hypothetical protein
VSNMRTMTESIRPRQSRQPGVHPVCSCDAGWALQHWTLADSTA